MTADLAAWLVGDDGPIAEDEARARSLMRMAQEIHLELQEPRRLGQWAPGWGAWRDVERLCERTLAECAAKRAIVGLYLDSPEAHFPDFDGGYQSALVEVVNAIAQVYAGRDGWREEWAT